MKKTKGTGLLMAAAMALTLAGCSDNDGNTPKADATGEWLTGWWQTTATYQKVDGEWEGGEITGGVLQILELRADGTSITERVTSDGLSMLVKKKWSVSADGDTLVTDTVAFPITRRTDNEFDMTYSTTINNSTGESKVGEFKWTQTRLEAAPNTLIYQLVGTWDYVESQQMKDGNWTRYTADEPDKSWTAYDETGEMRVYMKHGKVEYNENACWGVNNSTAELFAWPADTTFVAARASGKIAFEGDSIMYFCSDKSLNVSTGEITAGEFRDKYVRRK